MQSNNEQGSKALEAAIERIVDFPAPAAVSDVAITNRGENTYDDYSDSVYVDSPYDDYQDK